MSQEPSALPDSIALLRVAFSRSACAGPSGRGAFALAAWFLVASILMPLLGGPSAARAADVAIEEVIVGFQGRAKAGFWAPVRVALIGGDAEATGRVEVVCRDCEGVPVRFPGEALTLTPGQRAATTVLARLGQADALDLTIEFVSGKNAAPLAERRLEAVRAANAREGNPTSLNQRDGSQREPGETADAIAPVGVDHTLWLELGSSAGLEAAIQRLPRADRERTMVARLTADELDQLPGAWQGYDSLDAIVISTWGEEGRSLLESLTASGRLESIETYVQLGGRLVLFVGESGDAALGSAEQPGPLARFAPGRFQGVQPLLRVAAIEEYTGREHPLTGIGGEPPPLNVVRLVDVDERLIELRQGDLPLVTRSPLGLGEVVLVALDPQSETLSTWMGRPLFLGHLLQSGREGGSSEPAASKSHQTGYDDIAGQLRAALDQVDRPSLAFGWIVLLIAVYAALVGPGDYFFVRRTLKRMEMTWISFPLIVAALSVGGWLAARQIKGDQLRVNQLDLVDVDTTSGLTRRTSWINLFSPKTTSYNVTWSPRALGEAAPDPGAPGDGERANASAGPGDLTWLGLPGRGLGGMSSGSAGFGAFSMSYRHEPTAGRLPELPIRVWDSRALLAQGFTREKVDIPSDLVDSGADELLGSFTSPLDGPLENAILAYGGWAYSLGTVGPRATVEVADLRQSNDLATLLTGRHVVRDERSNQFTHRVVPYDAAGVDVPHIVRQMSFFQAGGGPSYVGLSHRYHRFVDLSGHLPRGRAVVIGFVDSANGNAGAAGGDKQHGASVAVDGTPIIAAPGSPHRHWSCYRFVLPVKSRAAAGP